MSKSADAFRTISEVAEWLDTPAHVLRFWESKFTQVKPVKRAGGRRYYRPADMRLLGGIKKLLHEDGMTIKGAQKILREQGIKHVASLCTLSVGEEDDADEVVLEEVVVKDPVDTVVPFTKPAETAETEAAVEPVDADTPVAAEQPVDVQEPEPVAPDLPEPSELPAPDVESEQVVATEVVAEEPLDQVVASEPTPEADPVSEDAGSADAAALPGFLQRSMEERAEDPAPASEPVDERAASPDAVPSEPPIQLNTLTHLARLKYLSPESAHQIAPLAQRLRELAS